ncbi:MAG: 50S ribosomal protein L19 [Candidatus Moranbacteria bacterium]|nr:50S ribosomal protein L19 [Candidatus Moranbacteria bacterium]
MEKKIIEFNASQRAVKNEQEFHSGDVVKVFLRIKEGAKERTQLFEGLIIAVKGGQSSSPTITVRKVTHDVGVEMIIPVGSKNVEKIELVKRAKVRRAKLYYVRTLTTKQSRMKYKDVKDVNKKNKPKVEAVKAEVAPEKIEEKVDETKA